MASLKGCWQSEPFQYSPALPKSVSTYCFDEAGAGELESSRPEEPSYFCRVPVSAGYDQGTLRLQESDATCGDGTLWKGDRLDCQSNGSDALQCAGKSPTPGGAGAFAMKLQRTR
jgi:hypothetical protein